MQLTKKHRVYFDAAKSVSKLSNYKKVQIGAVAVYKHRIISSGHNSTKTNPIQKKYNIYRYDADGEHCVHAETNCLLPLIHNHDIDFSKVSIYIYREYKNGNLAKSRPCKSCEMLMRELGIRKIYYTNETGYIAEKYIAWGVNNETTNNRRKKTCGRKS